MKKMNYIVRVLDAIGEKIYNLELDISLKESVITRLKKENAELTRKVAEYENR